MRARSLSVPIWILPALIVVGLVAGCSGSGSAVMPEADGAGLRGPAAPCTSHSIWGLWEFTADPAGGTLDVVPLRSGSMHVNVLVLLEPPVALHLQISNLFFDDMVCHVDVTLVHPFPGLSQYIGFDVCGVLISKGTLSGFQDPDLVMAGEGDTRLLNADGYTRWWNPVEFSIPGQPIFRYKDGLLGNKNSSAHFDATLNGYKAFAEGLEKNDDVGELGATSRAFFLDGTSNTRHYTIDLAGGLIFNYAVDAGWEFPHGNPPYGIDDYSPEANKPEAWAVSITELENTLYNDGVNSGGSLGLLIDVWAHYNAGMNTPWVDSPGNFGPVMSGPATGGGEGYSTYEVEILDASPGYGKIDILIGIESEVIGYWDVLPDDAVTAYFVHTADVATEQPLGPTAIMEATTSTDIGAGESVSFDASASTGTPPLGFEWDFDGDGFYGGAGDGYTGDPTSPTHTFEEMGTFAVTVKVSNGYGEDISDAVMVHVGFAPGIYVDGDYTGMDSDGTPSKPFKTLQDGMSAAVLGDMIHVDYLDGGTNVYDTAGLTLKGGVYLKADNWNGGGPGKPKASCSNAGRVFFGQDVSDVTIEGFEIIVPAGPSFPDFVGQPCVCCVNLKDTNANSGGGSTNDNTIVKCRFTGSVTVTAGFKGVYLEGAVGTMVELCEFGDIQGVSSPNFDFVNCVMAYRSDDTTIRKNWVHDIAANASTEAGRIEIFRILWSDYAEVTNNLVHALDGINGYCNVTVVYIDGQPGNAHSYDPIVANNTAEDIQGGGYGFVNVILFSNTIGGTYAIPNVDLFNNIVSNTQGSASSRAYEFVQVDPSDPCTAYFCNAYNTAWLNAGGAEGYLYVVKGTGCYGNWTDPHDPDYIDPPDDYDLTSTSPCQLGDPSIVDWDDDGDPSGDPDDLDIEERSRMGAFGGPGGGWWPLE